MKLWWLLDGSDICFCVPCGGGGTVDEVLSSFGSYFMAMQFLYWCFSWRSDNSRQLVVLEATRKGSAFPKSFRNWNNPKLVRNVLGVFQKFLKSLKHVSGREMCFLIIYPRRRQSKLSLTCQNAELSFKLFM